MYWELQTKWRRTIEQGIGWKLLKVQNSVRFEKPLFPCGSDGKESTCNAGDLGLIAGCRRPSGEGNGYPLRYPCLENSMDRRTWQALGSQSLGLRVRPDWETNSFTFAKPLGIFPTESFCKYWYMIHVSVLNTWWKTIYTKKFTFKIRKNRMKIHKIIKMANGKALWVLYPLKFQMSLKFVISKKMRTFW